MDDSKLERVVNKGEIVETLAEVEGGSYDEIFPFSRVEEIEDESRNLRRSSFFVDENNNVPIMIIGPDNKEIRPEDIVVSPDGGYGWMIVFAAFMSNLIVDGSTNTTGIILLNAVSQPNQDNRNQTIGDETRSYSSNETSHLTDSEVSWIVGLLVGLSLFVGPFVSLLATKVGFRMTAVCGSVLTCLAYLLIFIFSRDGIPNIIVLFLCYGVIAGIGFGLMYVPAVITVGYYFQKRRALATGIAVCGSGVGTFSYSQMSGYLNSQYGWHYTVLVQGILLGVSIIFGCLYLPIKSPSQKTGPIEEAINTSSTVDHPVLDKLSPASEINITSNAQVNKLKIPEIFIQNSSIESIEPSMDDKVNEVAFQETFEMQEDSMTSLPDTLKNAQQTSARIRKSPPSSILENAAVFHPFSIFGNTEGWNNGRHSEFNNGALIKQLLILRTSITSSVGSSGDIRRYLSVTSGCRKSLRLKNFADKATGEEGKIITLLLPDSEEDITESRVYRVADRDTLNSPFNISSIFYPGSLSHIQDFNDNEEALAWEAVPITTEQLDDLITVSDKKICKCDFGILRKMLDFSLLKSKTFILLAIAGAITTLGIFIPFFFLSALFLGITGNTGSKKRTMNSMTSSESNEAAAASLISIIGITNTIGRILVGALADKLGKHNLLLNNIALTVAGLMTAGVPFLTEYYSFTIYSGLFGITIAFYVSLRSIILVQLLGLAKLTNAFGLLLLFQGISAIVGSRLAGSLYDATGTYAVSFYFAGGMIALSGILCYPLHYLNDWEQRGKKINRVSTV